MSKCKATNCPEPSVCSSLCDAHYAEWRNTINNHKTAKKLKAELEKKYDMPHEPMEKKLWEY